MLCKDQPIIKKDDDILHRQPFVNEIKKLIVEYTKQDTDGLVIGLEGSWGSGKTSILNLLEQAFTEESDDFVVRRLDSWLAVDSVSLTLEFFKTLREAAHDAGTFLNGNDYIKEQLQKAPRFILKGLKASGVSFNLPGISVKPDWDAMLADKTLREKKEEIRQNLKASPKHIIYMIDDVDRLNSEEVALVMQLVKNLADFPNVIYVLAYDRDIVSNALQHIDGRNGADFMEKIVQVPIAMPEFDQDDLINYFNYQLDKIIATQKIKTADNLLQYTIRLTVPLYIHNIRDCKRVLNAFRVRYLVCADFCDVRDLFCVILLEIYEPKVLAYILKHMSAFCLTDVRYHFENSKPLFDEVHREFNQLSNNIKSVEKIIGIMFPDFTKKAELETVSPTSSEDDILTNRIAYKENFYLYFILSRNERVVLSETIQNMLLYWDQKHIQEQLLKWRTENILDYVWKKIDAFCDIKTNKINLSEERVIIFLRAITPLQDKPVYQDFGYSWMKTVWYVVNKSVAVSSFFGGQGIISASYKRAFLNIFHDSKISLETLEVLMWNIGKGYKWNHDINDQQPPLVDKAIFDECKAKFLSRLIEGLKTREIFGSILAENFIKHLVCFKEDFIRKYLLDLTSVDEIFLWLNFAFSETKSNEPGMKQERIWHHRDWLIQILPEKYTGIVREHLKDMPKDWISTKTWPIYVLYSAYMNNESWAKIEKSMVRFKPLCEYGERLYRENNHKGEI